MHALSSNRIYRPSGRGVSFFVRTTSACRTSPFLTFMAAAWPTKLGLIGLAFLTTHTISSPAGKCRHNNERDVGKWSNQTTCSSKSCAAHDTNAFGNNRTRIVNDVQCALQSNHFSSVLVTRWNFGWLNELCRSLEPRLQPPKFQKLHCLPEPSVWTEVSRRCSRKAFLQNLKIS